MHVLDGDASLRRRPVARIIEPLRRMGAVLHARRDDSLPPLTVIGRTRLQAIDYSTAVPSAQVKSAILLAGLRADGVTRVREAIATRDHTERMLRARGVAVERAASGDDGAGVTWSLEGGGRVRAIDQRVPADISAAAFWLVAGAIHPDAELTLRGVGLNPTRRAVVDLLLRMGARRGRRRGVRRWEGRAGRGPVGPLEPARGRRHRPRRGRRRDRRDPDPLPRRDPGPRTDDDPRCRRAPAQGIRPDRRDRRRPPRARWTGRRCPATTSRSMVRRR